MSLWPAIACAIIAAIAFSLGGYLLGLRREQAERVKLRAELKLALAGRSQLEQQLRTSSQSLAQLKNQLGVAQSTDPNGAPLRDHIDNSIRSVLEPVLKRDLQSRELHDAINGLLRPMVEREKLGIELTRLDGNFSGRAGLSQLLTTIAKRAGFSTVLITDNSGLPVAQNDGPQSVDMLVANVGLLLGLTERIISNGAPAPLAVVLRDSDNGLSVHRFFRVEDRRYVLTAITSGSFMSPDVLDPTLARIERVMTDRSQS